MIFSTVRNLLSFIVHIFSLLAEEEKDVDDWDVDMSVYYDADGGDKDARDMVTMRRETRRRTGRQFRQDDEKFESAIGKFERHSKVFICCLLYFPGHKTASSSAWCADDSLPGNLVTGLNIISCVKEAVIAWWWICHTVGQASFDYRWYLYVSGRVSDTSAI